MRALIPLSLALGFITTTHVASAQSVRVGIERAFGFTYTSNTRSSSATVGGVTTTRETSSSSVALNVFGSGFSNALVLESILAGAPQPPRLAVDYELASHLTVGAAAYVAWASYSVEGSPSTLSLAGFGLAPRVGYSIAMGDRFSFWPRVGVSFGYASISRTSTGSSSELSGSYLTLSLNVEPTLVYMLATHFGVTAMVFGDIPLVGNVSSTTRIVAGSAAMETTTESTYKQFVLGLQFGLVGRF